MVDDQQKADAVERALGGFRIVKIEIDNLDTDRAWLDCGHTFYFPSWGIVPPYEVGQVVKCVECGW